MNEPMTTSENDEAPEPLKPRRRGIYVLPNAVTLAALFAGMLYGGTVDEAGTKRVQTCSGPITAYLRGEWDLNRILNPNAPGKSRDDHRHHAVDAVAIAMCSQSMVQRLSAAASAALSAT